MLAGDYIRTKYVVEVAGVATQQSQDWLVGAVGSDPLSSQLMELANAWWFARTAFLGSNVLFSCLHYNNWSRPEQEVIYPLLTGTGGTTEIHPQYQCVRVNLYSDYEVLKGKILRGSTNIGGVIESLSTRGRINDLAEFQAARGFEASQFDDSPTGLILNPVLRWYDDGPVTPIYRHTPIANATLNPTFLTLRSRKTKLCS